MAKRKIRVAVLGVGYTGSVCIRAMHVKGIEIVAGIGHIHNIGKDIGEIAGIGPIGIPLTPRAQMEEVLDQTKPDILLDCTSNSMEELYPGTKMCFERGIHVMGLGTASYYPHIIDPKITEELDALGKAHNCCYLNSSSGEVWQGLTTMLTANSESIKSITLKFYALLDSFGESIAIEDGVGTPPELWGELEKSEASNATHSMWPDVVMMIAKQLGLHVTSIKQKLIPLPAKEDMAPPALSFPIKKGYMVGREESGEAETEEGITIRGICYGKFAEGDEQNSLICEVEGEPNLRLVVEDFHGDIGTSTIMINRIPDLFKCEPGMRISNDMPTVTYKAPSEYWIEE